MGQVRGRDACARIGDWGSFYSRPAFPGRAYARKGRKGVMGAGARIGD